MSPRKGTLLKDRILAAAGAEQFDGLSGYDVVSYTHAVTGAGIDPLNVALNTGEAQGDTYTSIEAYSLNTLADTFYGTGFADVVNGDAGNDHLEGRAGNDTLTFDLRCRPWI